MFKIGEFSKLTQVSIRMLRFYDENDLLKPAFIDTETGYRLYSVEQIATLQRIVMLRDCKFSTTQIRDVLFHWNTESIERLLSDKKEEILQSIRIEQERVQRIETAILDMKEQQFEYQYNIQFKSVPSYPVLSLRKSVEDYFEESKLWMELCEYVQCHKIEVVKGQYNNLSIYPECEEQANEVTIEIATVLPNLIPVEKPFRSYMTEELPLVAYMMVYGPYEHLAKAYEQMAYWLNEHQQYEMCGSSRQISHKGPEEGTSPAEYLTEIQIPVRKKITT